jgi:hypothetical protein
MEKQTVHYVADLHSWQEDGQVIQFPPDKYVPYEHFKHCLASLHSRQLDEQD